MKLLAQNIAKISVCCEVISLFVVFTVLVLRLRWCRPNKGCKLCVSFFVNISCFWAGLGHCYCAHPEWPNVRVITSGHDVTVVVGDHYLSIRGEISAKRGRILWDVKY